ncbi:MAG: DinB family protein [Chitinophagaceae bacterium]
MKQTLSIEEILVYTNLAFNQFTEGIKQKDEAIFFRALHENTWSIAQHIQHLIIATRTTTAAYALPKFVVRFVGGRPNRPSYSYDVLVEKYLDAIRNGGKATGRYIPKKNTSLISKEKIINNWQRTSITYLKAVKKNWTTEQLDKYSVKHSLLGMITLRELCYFTIYHTQHHLAGINKR